MTIIAITGQMNSGKTTIAEYLQSKGYTPISFAGPLKDIVSHLFNLDRDMVEGSTEESRKRREERLDISDTLGKDVTTRTLLQDIGVMFRDNFHIDIWCILAGQKIKPGHNYVFTDLRFPSEAEFIKKFNAHILRVTRKPLDTLISAKSQHSSETAMKDIIPDYYITNNGTKNDLYMKLDGLLGQFDK